MVNISVQSHGNPLLNEHMRHFHFTTRKLNVIFFLQERNWACSFRILQVALKGYCEGLSFPGHHPASIGFLSRVWERQVRSVFLPVILRSISISFEDLWLLVDLWEFLFFVSSERSLRKYRLIS